jgi:hypothetical protein
MVRILRRSRLPVLLALGLVLGACVNPFKPADPELPDANAVLEDFSWPDSVLDTMDRALETRSTSGASAYMRAFAESTQFGDRAFRAYYDGAVKSNWQSSTQLTAPEPWDVKLEQNLHTSIAGLRPSYSYRWEWGRDDASPNNEDPSAADTVLYHQHYELWASDGNTEQRIVVGFVDLSFQKKDGRWSLFRWVDRVDPLVGVTPVQTDERTMSWWRLESLTRK